MTMARILEAQRTVKVLRPGRRSTRRPPPTRAETPAAQLEIAAQWLHEAALLLTELKHPEVSMQLTRVGHDCQAMVRKMGRA
jgi:hypothetical protein